MCALPEGKLKLTDWESGVEMGKLPALHTEGYSAPETRLREDRFFCEKSDVFSAGVAIGKWMNRLRKLERNDGKEEMWRRVIASLTEEKVAERWDAERALREVRGMH